MKPKRKREYTKEKEKQRGMEKKIERT